MESLDLRINWMSDTHIYQEPQMNKLLAYASGNHSGQQGPAEPWQLGVAIVFCILQVYGLVGTLIILFTMCVRSTFLVTYRIYLSLTALSDLILIFLLGTNMAVDTFFKYNITYKILLESDITCRAYHVFLGFLVHFNIWLHVAMMIELYVMSVFPKKLNSVSSYERAHYLTLLILTVCLIINMNYFWTIKRQKEPLRLQPHYLCYFDAAFEMFETEIYPVIDCAVVGVIPLITWIGLLIFTARKFCTQGEQKPGGLLISTGEYYRITYSVTTLYLIGHLPKFVWMLYKFIEYSIKVENEPGITTLQNFHTELIDGDFRVNLVFAFAMAMRVTVLLAVSPSFRSQFQTGINTLFRCGKSTNSTIAQGAKLAYKMGMPLIVKRNHGTQALQ